MFEVRITAEAQAAFLLLPLAMQTRVQQILLRLARWPNVSGTKALKRELPSASELAVGAFCSPLIRPPDAALFRIDNRRDVYE